MKLTKEEYERFIKIQCRKAISSGTRLVDFPTCNGNRVKVVMEFEPSVESIEKLKAENISVVTNWKFNKEDHSLDEFIDYLINN